METPPTDSYGLGDPLMLEKIDKLFACGVGEYIYVPQIVVVGDQSSGKSSVLEGLIRKPLPRNSGLCTRFATQIVFRRSKHETISVSIIPGSDATDDEKSSLASWKKKDIALLDNDTFSSIMKEAEDVMGLSVSPDKISKPFSNHVLRMEITGPHQEHLSVIDVPGIFRNPTPGVTTKADIEFVRNMVLSYMENPRSVMLAVIPANVDIATQEILQLAEEVDPEGDRTLGILTKPDLVDPGAEAKVVDLIEGRERPMKLGWHIVRNPGQTHLFETSFNREALELDFFRRASPWKDIAPEKKGVEHLRTRLKEVLSSLVKRVFPKVRQEVLKRLSSAHSSLDQLGMDRSTSHAQAGFLTELATRFQHLASLALDAKYAFDVTFERNPPLKLATLAMNRFSVYSNHMACYGHEFKFSSKIGTIPGSQDRSEGSDVSSCYELDTQDEEQLFVRKYENAQSDVEDILHPQEELSGPSTGSINEWLLEVYKTSRGFELGTFGASILPTTMKRQSLKWESISLGFVSDMVVVVDQFVNTILDEICPTREMNVALRDALIDGLRARYRKAIEHVHFLLTVERSEIPLTSNHYFADNLEKRRQRRMIANMSAYSIQDKQHGAVVPLQEVKHIHPMGNTDHTVQDIHDILRTYYKVARKRFTDNVLKQATNHYLLIGPDTPIKFFSPTFVNSLTSDVLEHIAGEAPNMKRKRVELAKEISSLTAAKAILLQRSKK